MTDREAGDEAEDRPVDVEALRGEDVAEAARSARRDPRTIRRPR